MKRLIILSYFVFCVTSCNSSIDGEGPATAEHEVATDLFAELRADCNCILTLIPSENPKVIIESHQNLIDNLNVDSKRNRLEISENKRVDKYALYNVNVYFNPELNTVVLKGNTKMKVSGTLKAVKMNFELKDNSSISDTYTDIEKIGIKLKNSCIAQIRGTAISLDADVSGRSNADLAELQSVDVNFKTADEAQLSVFPLKNMTGTANGNSIVKYKGDPNKDTTAKEKAIIQQN
ncbi:MAG: DUF2807 domain-containing protein [Weeksellaceae bacterium]